MSAVTLVLTMRYLLPIAGLVLSAIALAIVLSQVSLQATLDVLAAAQPFPLLVAFALLILQFAVLTIRWRMLLSVAADGRPVPWIAVVEALLVGVLANAALPARLGEVARTVVVARRGAIDLAGSAGTVILERVLDVTVLAGAALVAAIAAQASWLLSWPLAFLTIGGTLFILVAVSGAVPTVTERLLARIPTVAHHPSVRSTLDWISRLLDGLAGHHPGVVARALALTTVSVILDGAIFWTIGLSLGIELSWAEALLLGAAGVLATGIPSAPANIGTFELAIAVVGGSLGIPGEGALALALIAHIIIVVPLSAAGAAVLVLSMRGTAEAHGRDPELASVATTDQ